MNYRKLSILIVESNTGLRAQMVDFFAQKGVDDIQLASNFSQAKAIAYKKPNLDLIFFDLEIPKNTGEVESGLDFLDELKRLKVLPLRTILIALTADAQYSKIYEAIKQGVDTCLIKPLSIASLTSKIEEVGNKKLLLKSVFDEIEKENYEIAYQYASKIFYDQKNQVAGKIAFELLLKDNLLDRARRLLSDSNQLDQPWIGLELAKLDLRMGAINKGWDQLKNLCQKSPNDPELLEALYYGLWEAGSSAEAIQALEQSVAMHPFNPARVQLLSLAYFKERRPDAQAWLLKAFSLTKSSKIMNYSLLINILLSALSSGTHEIDPVLKFMDKTFTAETNSLRMNLITKLIFFIKDILLKKDANYLAVKSHNLIEEINSNMVNRQLDWDCAYTCLQVIHRTGLFEKHEEYLEVIEKIVKRFGTVPGYLNSIKKELSTNKDLCAKVDFWATELSVAIQGLFKDVSLDTVPKIVSELFKLTIAYSNPKALNLGLGLLTKYREAVPPDFFQEFDKKFRTLRDTGYFSGATSITNNKWYMNGRY